MGLAVAVPIVREGRTFNCDDASAVSGSQYAILVADKLAIDNRQIVALMPNSGSIPVR